jgi:LCP family protein required for cell wall assembly
MILKNRIFQWMLKLILACIGAVFVGVITFNISRNRVISQIPSNRFSEPAITDSESVTPDEEIGNVLPTAGIATDAPVLSLNKPLTEPQLTPWDGVGRVTVLVMGLDYRDWQAGEKYSRSDTMILLTLDPLSKTAGILSIPRDLWVAIPGFQHAKINTAYYLGDAYKLPDGGPGLAVKTVELFLGVPINYYAVIDFNAFVKFIDDIGGVKIDVPAPIRIDLLGGGSQTIKNLQPGVQVLPGEWALAYARNRHTAGGDFDRARRQQQVILGIRNRILDFNMLPKLIANAPALYQDLSSGIRTNLTLEDALRLALLAEQVDTDHIQQDLIGEKDIVYGWSPDRLSILIPIPDKVAAVRDEIFATGVDIGPLTPGDSLEKMIMENARIGIYNGSRKQDLSAEVAKYLDSSGVKNVTMSDSPQPYSNTTLVDHTGNPYTLNYLVNLLKISPYKIQFNYNLNTGEDVEVYLGNDAEGVTLP